MIHLYVEAPFAVFRAFTAGWYRPSSQFMTPSAAYGLLLNLAGIEMRLPEGDPHHSGKVPSTLTKANLPLVKLAIGVPSRALRREGWVDVEEVWPSGNTLFQQLHNYPVGASGKERKALAKGQKYNITPVQREILSNFRCIISVDAEPALEQMVKQGLAGELAAGRYGLPFLGDNSFLPDRIEVVNEVPPTYWLVVPGEHEEVEDDRALSRVSRVTLWIDRANMAHTKQVLVSPILTPTNIPPTWFTLPDAH
jgi:CRISPR-associated protein Cas5t